MTTQLSDVERLAARMFHNVSVQSAFAKEDPNVRFVAEFQHEEGAGMVGARQIEDVENKTYTTEVSDGRLAFEANPKGSPALSRVLMWGGRREAVIEAIKAALSQSEHFKLEEMAPLPANAGVEVPEDAGNRLMRLVISEKLNAQHDVAALFAWGASSDKAISLELMAWPIAKTAETNS